jgi:EamA domain-containing membrane protein RarD
MKKMIKHRLFWGMVLVIMLMACSKQQSEHKTVTVSSQYETLRGDVMAMLNENPDSVFIRERYTCWQ